MSDKITPVRPGEKLKADTINKIIRRVDGMNAPHVSATAARYETSPGTSDNVVSFKNTTDAQLLRGNIISLGDVLQPVDMESAPDTIVYTGIVPNPELPFAILIEHVKPGMIGKALVYGRIQTRIEILNESHHYAEVKEGDCTVLQSCESGPCRILWKTTGNIAIAEIQFPIAKNDPAAAQVNDRMHSHADNSWQQKGLSFAVYSPGCSIPAMPFE